MSSRPASTTRRPVPRRVLAAVAGGPQLLAFLPAITLAAYWLGGEGALLLTAIVLPALFAASGLFGGIAAPSHDFPDRSGELPGRTSAVARADALQDDANARFAVIAVGIDEAPDVEERLGPAAFRDLTGQVGARIASAVRPGDLVARLSSSVFGVVLASCRSDDVETLLQIAVRLGDAVAEPVALDGSRIYVTASTGVARSVEARHVSGEELILRAERALAEAEAHGARSVRVWSSGTALPAKADRGLAAEVSEALLAGQFVPWFQPQVDTQTGTVTGVEALARWVHPVRGLVAPAAFLPAVDEAGLADRFGATILHAALAALRAFDEAGRRVPRVAVNFSTAELRNPGIVDRVRWELDRAGLSPDRLTVEVLETVMDETGDDVVTRNLSRLAALGCGIDLDDFGTGHAAIGSIRRFSVQRVKIDRSFVRRIDTDTGQQDVVSAMVLMSERLGLDTLAEGVETAAEQAALLRLGCRHVQGFLIARPMPEAAMLNWLSARSGETGTGPVRAVLTGSGPAGGVAGKTA